MNTFLLVFLLTPVRLGGLRLKGDPKSPPFSILGEEYSDNISVREDAMADIRPGECALNSNPGASLADYLVTQHVKCEMQHRAKPPPGHDQLLKRFSRPELVYRPYVTSLPVFYISQGGQREACFAAFLQDFSPEIHRIDAVTLGDDTWDHLETRLAGVVDEDSIQLIIDHSQNEHSQDLGIDVVRKRWGCLLAHLQAILMAYQSNQPAAIILEDDAVPLYPSWTTTLEYLLFSLPPGWQALQLQWSKSLGEKELHKRGAMRFEPGSGWGTTAYILHRRGMKHVLDRIYDEESGKFQLESLTKCRDATADDCLLGFTRLHLRSRPLERVYRATPPLFLHDSKNTAMHKLNFCEDLALSADFAREEGRAKLMKANGADGLLLFFAVGSSPTKLAKKVLESNIQCANSSDIFLAYADHDDDQEDAEPSARKLRLMQRLWPKFGPAWSKRYTYIWAVNEDVRFQFSPHEMVREAKRTGMPAVSPVLKHRFVRQRLSTPGSLHGRTDRVGHRGNRQEDSNSQAAAPAQPPAPLTLPLPAPSAQLEPTGAVPVPVAAVAQPDLSNHTSVPKVLGSSIQALWRNRSPPKRDGRNDHGGTLRLKRNAQHKPQKRHSSQAPPTHQKAPGHRSPGHPQLSKPKRHSHELQKPHSSRPVRARPARLTHHSSHGHHTSPGKHTSRGNHASHGNRTSQGNYTIQGDHSSSQADPSTSSQSDHSSSQADHSSSQANHSSSHSSSQANHSSSQAKPSSSQAKPSSSQANHSSSQANHSSSQANHSSSPGKHSSQSKRSGHNSHSSHRWQSPHNSHNDSSSGEQRWPLLSHQQASSNHSFGPKTCRYRMTNYINALAPMMTPPAWRQVFSIAGPNCSFAGEDQMWCDSLQGSGLQNGQGHNSGACAILDRLVVKQLIDSAATLSQQEERLLEDGEEHNMHGQEHDMKGQELDLDERVRDSNGWERVSDGVWGEEHYELCVQ